MWKMKKTPATVIGLAAAVVIAVPAIALASYQGGPSATSVAAQQAAPSTPGGHGPGQRGAARLDAIAQQLGVTTDVLQAAIKTARTSVGKPAPGTDPQTYRASFITALEAALPGVDPAKIQAAFANGPFGAGHPGDRGTGNRGTAQLDSVAQQLGVTTDVLQAAIKTARTSVGKPAAGTDPQTYKASFITALEAALPGVDPAKIEAAFANGPLGLGGRPAFGGHGPRGHFGGPRGGAGQQAPTGSNAQQS
jgi:hypothetical protein